MCEDGHDPLRGASAADRFAATPRKAMALFGMSGVGKTSLARRLRDTGRWFHYSVDYRIGTRYMGEHIVDEFKREAMKSPLLRALLLSDSISIASNITFENLNPLSTYLGKPGATAAGGLAFEEYVARQRRHRAAEINAMLDAPHFIERARDLYAYPHFLCDTSGSLVEVVDPDDPNDPIMSALAPHLVFVYIRGAEGDEAELLRRFCAAPKPMYFEESFLRALWSDYLEAQDGAPGAVDPDAFMRWAFQRLIRRRAPRYQRLAERWGVTIEKDDAAAASEDEFLALIDAALAERARKAAAAAEL